MTPPPISAEMFPGLLADLVEASVAHSEAHPAAIALHALVALGNIVSRAPHVAVGKTRHALNEFCLIVGPTSSGRKGDARSFALAPFMVADPRWQIASGLSSGEGLIHAVRDPTYGVDKKTGLPVLLDPGIEDKRLLVVETEASAMLKMFRREGNILSNVLRDAWDGKLILRTLTKTSPTCATEAHLSLIAHSTVEDLRTYLTDLDIANGLANRLLIAAVQRVRELPSPPPLPPATEAALVSRVRDVLAHAEAVRDITRTPAAEELWRTVYPGLTADRPGLAGALLARGAAHVVRLSALCALCAQASRVDVCHLQAALRWWTYLEASVGVVFADRTGNKDADRIKAELLPGQSMDHRELRDQIFSNHITAGRLRDALDLLMRLGEITVHKEETAGRPRIVATRLVRGAAA